MLDDEDVALMLHEVERFCRSELQVCLEHPESPLSPVRLSVLTGELQQMGILNITENAGAGLWEHCDSGAAMRFNIQALQAVAAMSAGAAFYWHRIGLAGWLLRRTGLTVDGPAGGLSLLTQGHYGLARDALPTWLNHDGMNDHLDAVMGDWLHPGHCLHLLASPEWRNILLPQWDRGSVQWGLMDRSSLAVTLLRHAPGFDELSSYQLECGQQPRLTELSAQQSRDCFRDLLILDAIGLMAIALGSLQRAARQAHDYAHTRIQGGTRIVQHPAVSLMLADIQTALQSSELQLGQLQHSLTAQNLTQVMRMRAVFHPLLCKAADQAIQVHGGIGYMRDCGVEKVWREQQTLRRLCGTTLELRLLTATLEDCA